jgi:hypothetical protein
MTLTIWLILIIVGVICVALYFRQKLTKAYSEATIKERNLQYQHQEEVKQLQLNSFRRSMNYALYQSLSQMDKTCDFFTNEDEANRELTTCLNLLGHNSQYHYPISSGRTVDILVDNAIIEGKLNPKQSDIDRLIGQVGDYLTFPHLIYIVLYGKVEQNFINRINTQIIIQNPTRVSLVHLPNAKRTKNAVGEESYESSRVVFA